MREIAREAGVNLALINYHFGSKEQLVLDVLDSANARLLERQRNLYAAPSSFAEKWDAALRFYEDDLASGFVRVQAELLAAGYANDWLREKVAQRMVAWGDVVHGGVREAIAALKAAGVELPAPLSDGVIANWLCNYWVGLEVGHLLGGWQHHERNDRSALDAIRQLLVAIDTRTSRQAEPEPHPSSDAPSADPARRRGDG